MVRRRHTPEQIVRKLNQADRMLNEGADAASVARHLQVSEQTYHRWRNQFGGMKADDVKRLKELEKENAQLKRQRLVADKELENLALREIASGKMVSPSQRRRAAAHAPRAPRPLAAAGLPDRRPAPLDPTPPASRCRPRLGSAPAPARLRPAPSPLGLSTDASGAVSGEPGPQPQESPASVA